LIWGTHPREKLESRAISKFLLVHQLRRALRGPKNVPRRGPLTFINVAS
jgi:hypothetical protein